MSITDAIKAAIKAAIERRGLTAYAVAKKAGIKPDLVSRFLSGERTITLATADKIAAALGLVISRAGELPTERLVVDRRDYGAMTVWTVEMAEGRRVVAIRPAHPDDETDYAWMLCVDNEPNEFSDSRDELEASVREWLDMWNAE